MPAHTFQISYIQGDNVTGVVSWNDSRTDLDLYVYTNNQQIFNDEMAASFYQGTNRDAIEPFQFNSIQTNTGILYLRVHPYFLSSTFVNY